MTFNVNLEVNMDNANDNRPVTAEQNSSSIRKSLTTDTRSAVKVAVRMRPLSQKEKSAQGSKIKDILIKDNQVVVPSKTESFKFDYCLNSSDIELFNYASQETVYRQMGEPLLDLAFQGYNTCLFAYGQSGSGKFYYEF